MPTGYIYPKEERALRDLLRRRLLLVRQRSLHHVSLQSLIARHSGQRLNTYQIKTLETGTIERFASPGNYASYARCVKSEKISNGKYKGQGNKKNGNKYLAWAFMEAAHYGAIWNPSIKRYYQRKQAKAHILVAKKAVANKLARACYHMLKRGEVFDVTRAFS